MTDKQLRSLSKTQLYDLLLQQEREIERLAEENTKLSEQKFNLEQVGSLAEASIMVSGIVQAAQSAADVYLDSIRNVEAEKMENIGRLEEEARTRALRESEKKAAEAMAQTERLVAGILRAFDSHVVAMAGLKEDLSKLISNNNLQHLIPGGTRTSKA